jgi:hypothetical protein
VPPSLERGARTRQRSEQPLFEQLVAQTTDEGPSAADSASAAADDGATSGVGATSADADVGSMASVGDMAAANAMGATESFDVAAAEQQASPESPNMSTYSMDPDIAFAALSAITSVQNDLALTDPNTSLQNSLDLVPNAPPTGQDVDPGMFSPGPLGGGPLSGGTQ